MIHVISVSGGKDSAALWSWAKRTQIPHVAVACDTGWEAEFEGASWSAYVAQLSAAIGEPLRIVRAAQQFEARARAHGGFPGRIHRRWCTEELKLEPFKAALDAIREEFDDDVTVVLGIRAEESADRAKLQEREYSDFYDCEIWRPLIGWTLAQVIEEHHRSSIPLNPLYGLGAERVGCWPCIKAGKREIEMVARLDPARIDRIRAIEEDTGNKMFCLESSRAGGAQRKQIPVSIDRAVEWSKTERGGVRLAVVREPSGCARWGICEPAQEEERLP